MQSRMASLGTSLMVKVLQVYRKCWRCALASSCAFPQNWLACTMLMRAGLSSNPLSPTSTAAPVRMLVVVGAENSQRVLLAMASNSIVKLYHIWLSSNSKVDTLLSLTLVLLSNASRSSMKFIDRSKLVIHYPA
jgi:hypothetical protein